MRQSLEKTKEMKRAWHEKNRKRELERMLAYKKGHMEEHKKADSKYKATLKGRMSIWKGSAKKRGIDWSLTLEILEQMPKVCYYTNQPLTFERDKPDTISLDRIDSGKGYESGNVVFCRTDINYMKQQFDLNVFVELCGKVWENRNNLLNLN